MNEGFEAIHRQYGVRYAVGDAVKVDGKPGRIVGANGQYLKVEFEGQAGVRNCHPTWRVLRIK